MIQKLTEIRIMCFNRSWWIQLLQTWETCKCNLLGRKCRISATIGKLIFEKKRKFKSRSYLFYYNCTTKNIRHFLTPEKFGRFFCKRRTNKIFALLPIMKWFVKIKKKDSDIIRYIYVRWQYLIWQTGNSIQKIVI